MIRKSIQTIESLALHLCNGDQEKQRWLMKWLAYGLQNPYAPKGAGVLICPKTNRTGVSLFFENIIPSLYAPSEFALQAPEGLYKPFFSFQYKATKFKVIYYFGETLSNHLELFIKTEITTAPQASRVLIAEEAQIKPDFRFLNLTPSTRLQGHLLDETLKLLKQQSNTWKVEFKQYLMQMPLDSFHPHNTPESGRLSASA